ncbi:hypothetical protein D7D25_15580 [Proteiniphilum sp. X52]|nr:hypothetical protein D7D25_15580 [Proteiniphilum sp. X52]
MTLPSIRVEDSYHATATSSEWAPFYPEFPSESRISDGRRFLTFSYGGDGESWTCNNRIYLLSYFL